MLLVSYSWLNDTHHGEAAASLGRVSRLYTELLPLGHAPYAPHTAVL